MSPGEGEGYKGQLIIWLPYMLCKVAIEHIRPNVRSLFPIGVFREYNETNSNCELGKGIFYRGI
jgi:hypothetical protein